VRCIHAAPTAAHLSPSLAAASPTSVFPSLPSGFRPSVPLSQGALPPQTVCLHTTLVGARSRCNMHDPSLFLPSTRLLPLVFPSPSSSLLLVYHYPASIV
jgi:hypothetical protein